MKRIASAIILTLPLIGMLTLAFNIQPIESHESSQLILETNKVIYALGENVTITLLNVGNETVDIGGYPAWEIFTFPEKEPVYPRIFAFLAWQLEPGKNDSLVWNQFNEFTESFIGPGKYVVEDYLGWGLSVHLLVTIPGDINGDKFVNAKDAVGLGVAFSSMSEDPNWNVSADINSDGRVNAKDAVIMGVYFGQSWI